ncbi:hypothetical protein AB0L65_10240 [Nonomuraea sp. NPDC052116]|uniref:hypothetical protein n=1 Tax=Nonomuraea sp. NPDC052116 TaxID=3155665 RepID=UPI00341229E7
MAQEIRARWPWAGNGRDKEHDRTPKTLPYTRALAAHGFTRSDQGNAGDGRQIIQGYRSPDGHVYQLTIPDGPGRPVIVEDVRRHPGHAPDRIQLATVPPGTPVADVALIAAAHAAYTVPATV